MAQQLVHVHMTCTHIVVHHMHVESVKRFIWIRCLDEVFVSSLIEG